MQPSHDQWYCPLLSVTRVPPECSLTKNVGDIIYIPKARLLFMYPDLYPGAAGAPPRRPKLPYNVYGRRGVQMRLQQRL